MSACFLSILHTLSSAFMLKVYSFVCLSFFHSRLFSSRFIPPYHSQLSSSLHLSSPSLPFSLSLRFTLISPTLLLSISFLFCLSAFLSLSLSRSLPPPFPLLSLHPPFPLPPLLLSLSHSPTLPFSPSIL